MTRGMFLAQWNALQQRMAFEMKQKMRFQAAMFGIDIDGKKTKKTSKNKAQEIRKNLLKDFPNDVEYLTKQDVSEKMGYAGEWHKRSKGKPVPIHIWNSAREEAALGDDVVAKRASANDILWKKYTELVNNGVEVTVDILKKIVEFDVLRSQLYPNSIQIADRNYYEKKNNLSLSKVDPDGEPPEWFTKHLQETGEMEGILEQLRKFCRGGR